MAPGVGVGLRVVPPSPLSEEAPSDGVRRTLDGVREGDGESSVVDGVLAWPDSAPPTVVLTPPLKLSPETSSYVVIPAIVTPKTRVAATSGRFQLLTRAR